jgi:hypothetical protein
VVTPNVEVQQSTVTVRLEGARPRSNFRSNRKHSLAGKARFLSKTAGYSADASVAKRLAQYSVTVVFSPTAGTDAEAAFEDFCKGRLIRKTRLQRDVNKWDVCVEQQLLGMTEPLLDQPSVG